MSRTRCAALLLDPVTDPTPLVGSAPDPPRHDPIRRRTLWRMLLADVDPDILANATGVLGTLDSAGRPQLTVVWFIVRDGHVWISINATRQKARNLRANGDVSFLVTHPDSADYYAEIRGTATLVPDDDYRLADLIGEKYSADFRSFDRPDDGRFIVDIAPTKVIVADVR